MGHFDPKMTHPCNSASALRIFFQILHNKRGQEVHENQISGFSKKKEKERKEKEKEN